MASAASRQRDVQTSVMRLAITRWIRDETSELTPVGREPLDPNMGRPSHQEVLFEDGDEYPRFAEGTLNGDELADWDFRLD